MHPDVPRSRLERPRQERAFRQESAAPGLLRHGLNIQPRCRWEVEYRTTDNPGWDAFRHSLHHVEAAPRSLVEDSPVHGQYALPAREVCSFWAETAAAPPADRPDLTEVPEGLARPLRSEIRPERARTLPRRGPAEYRRPPVPGQGPDSLQQSGRLRKRARPMEESVRQTAVPSSSRAPCRTYGIEAIPREQSNYRRNSVSYPYSRMSAAKFLH